MEELLHLMETCTYSNEELVRFDELLRSSLGKLPSISMPLVKDRAIYRCRKHTLPFYSFHHEHEISFRTDLENIQQFGRCNVPNTSVFYGSITSGKVIRDGYDISILETTGLHDNGDVGSHKEGYELFTFGMWQATRELNIFVVPPSKNHADRSDLNKEIKDQFKGLCDAHELSEQHIKFYNLMGDEFAKVVQPNRHMEYGLTSVFSEIILGLPGVDGIAYPSVKAELAGFNAVFNPDIVDTSFELKRVGIGDLFKFKNHFMFRHQKVAEYIKGKPLVYNDAPAKSKISLKEVIENYKKVDDIDEHYIINQLLNYFVTH